MSLPNDSKKWSVLSKLNPGDQVKLDDGRIAVFTRLKQKKFIGTIDGTSYDIPVVMFEEVVERKEQKDPVVEARKLVKDELFYINKKGDALLFKFVGIRGNNIIGKNPISNGTVKIHISMYAGKVSEVK